MGSVIYRINAQLTKWGEQFQAPLLFGIRMIWGYFFFHSGLVKLGNLDAVASYFSQYAIPLPWLSALLTGCVHFFGGLAMMTGFMARLFSIPLALTMVVAYLTVHWKSVSLADPGDFFQALPFLFLYATLLIVAFGPGRWSVDEWLKEKVENVAQ